MEQKPPLENPVILHHLFSLMKPLDLGSCRSVSRTWYEISANFWYPSVQLKVQEPFGKAFRVLNRNGLYHYRNLKIDGQSSFDWASLELFRTSVGRHLTSLTLSHHKFESVYAFRQVIYVCCPLLKDLKIDRCRLPKGAGIPVKTPPANPAPLQSLEIFFGRGRMCVTWRELLGHFPLLCSFVISSVVTEVEINGIFEAICSLRATDPGILPLVKFSLYNPLIISQHPASLARGILIKALRIPLSSLLIKLDPFMEEVNIYELLVGLAKSVERIDIHRARSPSINPDWATNFPFGIRMNKLSSLTIVGNFMTSFAFLSSFPNIKSLQILNSPYALRRGSIASWSSVDITNEDDLNKLSSLQAFNLNFKLEPSKAKTLISCMTQLIELAMPLDYEEFQLVCRTCTALRKLRILGHELSQGEVEMITEAKQRKKYNVVNGNGSPLDQLLLLEEFTYPIGQSEAGARRTMTSFWKNK